MNSGIFDGELFFIKQKKRLLSLECNQMGAHPLLSGRKAMGCQRYSWRGRVGSGMAALS